MKITNLCVRDLHTLLLEKKISISELKGEFLKRIKETKKINAFLSINEEILTDIFPDQKILTGIPIAHKDIFCAQNVPTSCGSKMLEKFVSPYDSSVVERCRQSGMIELGRTNMDEFAMGSSGEHSAFGETLNPWNLTCSPGGSSSGSAAAVSARLTPVATATDTGGSIRQPAAFCGVSGIKPTYGRVSRWGMVAFSSSFDQGGVMAKSAEDCALLLSVLAGFDERDSTSMQVPEEDFTRFFNEPLTGVVVGVPKEFFQEGLDDGIAKQIQIAIQQFEKLGAKVISLSLPSTRHAISAYYILTSAEASSNLSRYDGIRYGYRAPAEKLEDLYKNTRSQGFGFEVKRRILIGTYVLSHGYYEAYYRRAMKVRQLIANDFNEAFLQCDVILGPTTPNVAFPLKTIDDNDPVSMYLQDIYTVPVNLAGLPALSIPCGFTQNMPVGLQLIGRPLDEARLLAFAHQYQKNTDFHLCEPPN